MISSYDKGVVRLSRRVLLTGAGVGAAVLVLVTEAQRSRT